MISFADTDVFPLTIQPVFGKNLALCCKNVNKKKQRAARLVFSNLGWMDGWIINLHVLVCIVSLYLPVPTDEHQSLFY